MTSPVPPLGAAPEHVHRELYERLVKAARARELLYYSQVGPMLKLNFESPADRNRIGHLLGEISRHEHAEGRPMLSSVVWYKDLSSPGPGLHKLGVELGVARGGESPLDFAIRQLNETFDFWSSR